MSLSKKKQCQDPTANSKKLVKIHHYPGSYMQLYREYEI